MATCELIVPDGSGGGISLGHMSFVPAKGGFKGTPYAITNDTKSMVGMRSPNPFLHTKHNTGLLEYGSQTSIAMHTLWGHPWRQ